MMTSISERFLAAVYCCSSSRSVKDRLAHAWVQHLDTIDASQLPEEVRANFIGVRNAMYDRQPLSFENAPLASVRKMSTAEAAKYIKAIVTIYADLIQIKATRMATSEMPANPHRKMGRNRRIQSQLN